MSKEKENKKVIKKEKQKKVSKLHEIRMELKKVKWPEGKEIVKYTIATIAFCLVLVAFFMLLDLLSSFVKELFM